ncbi:MAG TPA: hypothetical protein VGB28_02990 [Actinomycetota bacterium]|jgi:hypothetical protein
MKRRFLVRYDDGGEGVWAYLTAENRTEIYMRFPELEVADRPPAWMAKGLLDRLEREMTFDVDGDRDLLVRLRGLAPRPGPG